jgi:sugar transferase (PEP-CTERM/EpsH1 system associated)
MTSEASLTAAVIGEPKLAAHAGLRAVPHADVEGTVRVMHVVFNLLPGGMELGVIKLVNGLDRTRVRSAICSTRPAGSIKTLVAVDTPVYELRRRNGNDPALVWRLYNLFRRVQPHVVHTHGWGTLVEGIVAARLARVPAIVHGEHGTLQLRTYQRWIQRHGWAKADRVLSVSSRLAERMSAETGFPLSRIETIRNGVEMARFGRITRAEARMSLGLPSDVLVIGTAGRLVPVKDHASLLNAVHRLQQWGLRPTLLVAGDGPLRGSLAEQAAALGIAQQVNLLGHRSDIETILAALDLFVLSSTSEGLPNTVLEAMATGVPVVATRVGGVDELVEDGSTGLLVKSGDSDALAHALADLLRAPARRAEMAASARRRMETEFDIREMIRKYEALYLDLAGVRR